MSTTTRTNSSFQSSLSQEEDFSDDFRALQDLDYDEDDSFIFEEESDDNEDLSLAPTADVESSSSSQSSHPRRRHHRKKQATSVINATRTNNDRNNNTMVKSQLKKTNKQLEEEQSSSGDGHDCSRSSSSTCDDDSIATKSDKHIDHDIQSREVADVNQVHKVEGYDDVHVLEEQFASAALNINNREEESKESLMEQDEDEETLTVIEPDDCDFSEASFFEDVVDLVDGFAQILDSFGRVVIDIEVYIDKPASEEEGTLFEKSCVVNYNNISDVSLPSQIESSAEEDSSSTESGESSSSSEESNSDDDDDDESTVTESSQSHASQNQANTNGTRQGLNICYGRSDSSECSSERSSSEESSTMSMKNNSKPSGAFNKEVGTSKSVDDISRSISNPKKGKRITGPSFPSGIFSSAFESLKISDVEIIVKNDLENVNPQYREVPSHHFTKEKSKLKGGANILKDANRAEN